MTRIEIGEVETISKDELIEKFKTRQESPRIKAIKDFVKSGKSGMNLGKVANRALQLYKNKFVDSLCFFNRRGIIFVVNKKLEPELAREIELRQSYNKGHTHTEAWKRKSSKISKEWWAEHKRGGRNKSR